MSMASGKEVTKTIRKALTDDTRPMGELSRLSRAPSVELFQFKTRRRDFELDTLATLANAWGWRLPSESETRSRARGEVQAATTRTPLPGA
jgi:hypothetical protein